jgi:hypothetical protein
MFESLHRPHEVRTFQSRPTPRFKPHVRADTSENGADGNGSSTLGKRKLEEDDTNSSGEATTEEVKESSNQSLKEKDSSVVVSRVVSEVKGHTSYLVFASILPMDE